MPQLFQKIIGLLRGVSRRNEPAGEPSEKETQVDWAQWLENTRNKRRLYPDPKSIDPDWLINAFPSQAAGAIDAAGAIMDHSFNLLGSGPFIPIDPDRPVRQGGYHPIDWYLDPVSGLRFPIMIPHKEWDLYKMRPGMADVKLPWELARCQHWACLAQAYLLTSEEKYAREIVRQLEDFMEVNPVGMGINWTCTMDVALRAVNWALCLEMVRDCRAMGQARWEGAYRALFEHGRFIFKNLEDKYEVTSNHYLSNIVGLFYLGVLFQDLDEGVRWSGFARSHLEEEMKKQILPDGADFESSVPYHRLVTEMMLGTAWLAMENRQPLSAGFMGSLKAMVDFLVCVSRPDGLMPQIGDADDGRLHIFTGYGHWNPQDWRHLLPPAVAVLGNSQWAGLCEKGCLWEAVWWGADVKPFMP